MDIPLWEGEGLSCGVRLQKYPQAATKFGVLGGFGGFYVSGVLLRLICSWWELSHGADSRIPALLPTELWTFLL